MPRVLVTVGTDVHRFDRLMDWSEGLLARKDDVTLVVQHGTSRPVPGAENTEMMTGDRFAEELQRADLVIAQGGPGGIMEARSAGRMPVVVPRRAEFDEHVDNHQVIFASLLAAQGLVRMPQSSTEFQALVDTMLDAGSGRFEAEGHDRDEFSTNFQEALNLESTHRTGRIGRIREMIRKPRQPDTMTQRN
ncbi:MAG: glycosyl transferase family 28 [Actinobacteria bacterium]|nr:glycosyl transferase family 28 [Actinomycetota bacterium]